jgi:hypothetical protein
VPLRQKYSGMSSCGPRGQSKSWTRAIVWHHVASSNDLTCVSGGAYFSAMAETVKAAKRTPASSQTVNFS